HQLAEVELIADHIGIIDRGKIAVAGSLDDLKARYQRLQIVFSDNVRQPAKWVEGVEHVRQEGRMLSIRASHNVEAIAQQARSLPGTAVEQYPVSLKEIFLEHVRSN